MGGLFGGTTKTTSKSEPWAPQGDALKSAFSSAGDIYNQQKGTAYQGNVYASMDPATGQAIQSNLDYINGQGADNTAALTDAGRSLTDINGYQGALSGFMSSANADPTKQNIANAGMYADNPYLTGQIDAATRDVSRNFHENTIPGIDRAATGSGNINSSRAGIAAGIAQRGAQDQMGDIASAMRSNAYTSGLGLSEGARTANLGAQGSAAGLYGTQVGMGLDATTGGNTMAQGNSNAAIGASGLRQVDAQGANDMTFANWQGADTRESDLLNRYYSIIGANNWGGTQENTQKTSGNIFGQLLGGAASLAGLGVFGGGKK
jgi:hypothetical protein